MATKGSNTTDTIRRMKEDIRKLEDEQNEALKASTYLGTSEKERKTQNDRRATIKKLVDELAKGIESEDKVTKKSSIRQAKTQK